ncbi:hypothetical protein [Lachnoclostridium sp. An118]|uniref:hypothetical protein n=1 Tax=Lachnoclostridium sp. An118 TaxID=1965547 RepID=UPI000B37DC0B|nr:hypothetical protein [Lachnoclostridium sp. An118]OUQ49678.1 hypothetical protein B5E62_10070 [Lachnoclostridium sp. An118]
MAVVLYKLNEIIDIIESSETAHYAEEKEFLKEKLHPDLSFVKKDRIQQKYFCGREWLLERIREWLCNKDASRLGIFPAEKVEGICRWIQSCV